MPEAIRRLRRPWALAAIGVGLTMIIAGGFTTYRAYIAYHHANARARVADLIHALQNQSDTPGTLAYKVHNGQRVNILMLGYGGAGHDGPYLTDSILVISVQGPDRVALTSVPRDTYVRIPAFANGGEYDGKINTAYEIPLLNGAFGQVKPEYDQGWQGAGALASKVVGDYLGIPIDYWVGVDFSAFKRVVDALGGVDVVNPYALDDPEYPLGETTGFTHVHFDAGPLHLTGDRALEYVRERHADNDFGRSRRQQQVMAAIKDRAVSLGALPQLYNLFDALGDDVKTNMTLNDIRVFGGIAQSVSTPATHHVSIDDLDWQYDVLDPERGYILLARDSSLAYLHRFVQSEMVDPAVLRQGMRVRVVAAPLQASLGQGFGGIWTRLLQMLSFQVLAPGSAATAPPTTEVHDYSGGLGAATAAWLADYFGGRVITEPAGTGPLADPTSGLAGGGSPSPSASPEAADIVVVLGTDFSSGFDAEELPASGPPPANYVPPAVRPTVVAPAPSSPPSATPVASAAPGPSQSPPAPTPSAEPSAPPSAPPSPPASPPPSPQPSPRPKPSPS